MKTVVTKTLYRTRKVLSARVPLTVELFSALTAWWDSVDLNPVV